MAKGSLDAIIKGKFPDFTFYDEDGVEVGDRDGRAHVVFDCAGEVRFKGTTIIKDGDFVFENLPNWMWENQHTSYDCVIDYLINQHLVHSPFNADGSLSKRWISNLKSRLSEDVYSFETSIRMQALLSHWDTLTSNIEVFSDIIECFSAYVDQEGFTKNWIYIYDTVLQVRKLLYEGKYNYYTSNNYFIWEGSVYISEGIGESSSNDVVTICGRNLPVKVVDLLVKNKEIVTCKTCGTLVFKDKIVMHECVACCGFTEEDLKLKAYSDRATSHFDFKVHTKNMKKDQSKLRFFGVELEYEADGRIREAAYYTLKRLKDYVILKRDGTVSEGLEIVTAPADLETQKEIFESFFESLGDSPMVAKSNTGMHVHVDKGRLLEDNLLGEKKSYSKLSYLSIGKLSYFMQKEDNKKFIKFIGERESTYSKLGTNSRIQDYYKGSAGDRYQALNLNNENTIEFRLFATPMQYTNFCKNLEFCDAITTFCSTGNSSIKDMTVPGFLKYINEAKGQYPHLEKFIKGYSE